MFTSQELSSKILAYSDGHQLFSEFVDWFEDNCSGAYEDVILRDPCIAIDAALSEFHYDGTGEPSLKRKLADAIAPFALGPVYAPAHQIVFGKPLMKTRSANRSFQRVFAVA